MLLSRLKSGIKMKLQKRIAVLFSIQLLGLEISLLVLKAHLVKGFQVRRQFYIQMFMPV